VSPPRPSDQLTLPGVGCSTPDQQTAAQLDELLDVLDDLGLLMREMNARLVRTETRLASFIEEYREAA